MSRGLEYSPTSSSDPAIRHGDASSLGIEIVVGKSGSKFRSGVPWDSAVRRVDSSRYFVEGNSSVGKHSSRLIVLIVLKDTALRRGSLNAAECASLVRVQDVWCFRSRLS